MLCRVIGVWWHLVVSTFLNQSPGLVSREHRAPRLGRALWGPLCFQFTLPFSRFYEVIFTKEVKCYSWCYKKAKAGVDLKEKVASDQPS